MNQINLTTIDLIGGNQTFAMCVPNSRRRWVSASDLHTSVSFPFGRNKSKANYVEFRYVPGKDLYDVNFWKAKFLGSCIVEKTLISDFTDIYGENLRGLFERTTGLRTSLTHVYA